MDETKDVTEAVEPESPETEPAPCSSHCYLRFDWDQPGDIGEMLCNHCCLGNVMPVSEDQPYSDRHWQCEKCDSTFASWIYPLSLGQRCELWNRHISDKA